MVDVFGDAEVDVDSPLFSPDVSYEPLEADVFVVPVKGIDGSAGDATAVQAALAAHMADTTNVHGITDALELDARTEVGGVSPLQWYRNGKA
jgi:hypothetical protein